MTFVEGLHGGIRLIEAKSGKSIFVLKAKARERMFLFQRGKELDEQAAAEVAEAWEIGRQMAEIAGFAYFDSDEVQQEIATYLKLHGEDSLPLEPKQLDITIFVTNHVTGARVQMVVGVSQSQGPKP